MESSPSTTARMNRVLLRMRLSSLSACRSSIWRRRSYAARRRGTNASIIASGLWYFWITPCALKQCMFEVLTLEMSLNFFSMPSFRACSIFSGVIFTTKCTVASVWCSL